MCLPVQKREHNGQKKEPAAMKVPVTPTVGHRVQRETMFAREDQLFATSLSDSVSLQLPAAR